MQRVVVVTGASRGIGRATARKFCENGDTVIVNYNRSEAEAQAFVCEMRQKGANAVCYKADISTESGAKSLIDFALKTYRKIDVLVCNAGISKSGLITDMTAEEFDEICAVNLRGVFLASKAVLPAMISAKRGAIVTVSSIWGSVGASCEVAYSATKGGVISFTRALAKEVAPSGIRVNCVAPGVIQTDMLSCYSAEDMDALKQETPLGRIGTPEDVANAIFFLSTEESSFVTGQVLTVDGGFAL